MFSKTRANHYFSPREFASANRAREILDSLRPSLCAADGGARPKLRGHSVSSALPCISFHKRAEGAAGTFQRGKLPNLLHPETYFSSSIALLQVFCPHSRTRSIQQASMYSRNQTTIASPCKHRQPVFLHPTGTGTGTQAGPWLVNGCESTAGALPREILRKECSGSRQEAPARKGRALTPPNRLDLLIPSPASTLQVFQFIR